MTRLVAFLSLLLALTFDGGWQRIASGRAEGATREAVIHPLLLVVSPSGPYTTITSALSDAQSGDVIEVRRGAYPGPLVVDKSVSLVGVDWPVIDAGGQGTVVTLAAPDITFSGFEVRGSGSEPDRDHAGITLTAPRIAVDNNRLRDVLFGIFVAQADDAVLRGNDITSKPEYAEGRKGDGLRLWYSQRVTVENNHIHEARDVVMWYSTDVIMRDNLIEHGRYGVHLMYCDGAQIERNQLLDNSVGIYTMYSNNVTMRDNLIRGQRGPSGYALGFKDSDNVEVAGNALVDNRGGIYLDGTPFSPEGFGKFHDNVLAFNDVGVIALPAVRGNAFENNTFWENVEQVAVQGGGALGENHWQGNYWSDYTGFDADGDGRGDVPYRAERFFENLTDREPRLRALFYSPAAQAVEFAGAAFPVVRPQPKFTDPAPRVQPAPLPAFAVPQKRGGSRLGGAALALFGLSLTCGALILKRGGRSMRRVLSTAEIAEKKEEPSAMNPPSVQVTSVGKRYGQAQVLKGVSFEAHAGEALALWGANGAGKTTLLKALLGLIDFEGQIDIEGHDVRRAGKIARRSIGYVPQEAVFYDQSVQATMEFYARVKHVSPNRIPVLMGRLGLREHTRKPVPALSGGLKQRLALAIALLADPPVLLLDEPTASLDAKAQRDYLTLLTALRTEEHKTILFASHRLEEVEALANRVLVLEQGCLVEALHPVDLLAKLMPQIQWTLWVPEAQRPDALACLMNAGLAAHLNGRGTVVVRVRAEHKMQPLHLLQAQGIAVTNFETVATLE